MRETEEEAAYQTILLRELDQLYFGVLFILY